MGDWTDVSAILKRAVDGADVPAVAAMVANRDGPVFAAAYGTRNIASGAPMTTDTVVRIASMTKGLTATCAMQLVEQGRLVLDEPIGDLLPELGRARVLEGYDEQGKPKLRPPKRPITLRHLMTHTSGHSYEVWSTDTADYHKRTGAPSYRSGLNAGLDVPLLCDPGERWDYSISIDWVGKAVEAVSGLKLDDYMQQRLFAPLGMMDSGFRLNEAQLARRADTYVRKNGALQVFVPHPSPHNEFDSGGGAGSVYSTVEDYLKFVRMILQEGRFNGAELLKPATVALMRQNAIGALNATRLPTASPLTSNDVEFTTGMKWGLSFMVNPAPLQTGRSAGSLGWAGIMNSYYWIDPAKQIAGVFATQILPFCDAKALPLFEAFESAVYRAL